ncbi:non-specific lipid-transfer protein 2-like [Papaver somniferum]|uniref:non-specific lipid-transfer protein 2-like n=1 Tax=Papaver somniferum TaxID=3469 RepID=UPI000E700594|nr:non-specific lipid-transfer protein 2-like [Papaver somniferum]
MKATYTSLLVVAMLTLLLSNQIQVSVAVTCSAVQLAPCLGAMMSSGTQPSKACCDKLREQKPCLCGYMRDPNLRQYVNTQNAKKVANTCNAPLPNC